MAVIAFTCGDTNGIGPEISLKLFQILLSKNNPDTLLFICPVNIFNYYYSKSKCDFPFKQPNENHFPEKGVLNLISLPEVKIDIGRATKQSGKASYDSIMKAIELNKSGLADAIVTSPVSKKAFKMAGIDYPGHTELLADKYSVKNFLMVFLSKKFNAGLVTIHIPIKKVPENITSKKIISDLDIILNTAKNDLKIKNPKVAVLGLNPHAGENGIIGNEEIKFIIPAVKKFNSIANVEGPFVPDAFFGTGAYKNYDFILGMYHDQVLIPFKLLNFSVGVNFTAGLPVVRTSPDHGVAYDIAGKNKADYLSLQQAYLYASKIIKNRKHKIA